MKSSSNSEDFSNISLNPEKEIFSASIFSILESSFDNPELPFFALLSMLERFFEKFLTCGIALCEELPTFLMFARKLERLGLFKLKSLLLNLTLFNFRAALLSSFICREYLFKFFIPENVVLSNRSSLLHKLVIEREAPEALLLISMERLSIVLSAMFTPFYGMNTKKDACHIDRRLMIAVTLFVLGKFSL